MKSFNNIRNIFIALFMISNKSAAVPIYIGDNSNNNYIHYYNKNEKKDNNYDFHNHKNIAIRTGFSFGLHFGYQINNIYVDDSDFMNATDGIKSFNFNGSPVGLHADYNLVMTDGFFVGVGYDINHSLSNRNHTVKLKIPSWDKNGDPEDYFLTTRLVFKKGLSQAFTARFGIANEYIAVDLNMSVVRSSFTHGFSIIDRLKAIEGYNNKTINRMGLAPGFGVTVPVNMNFSIGFNYRYEIYPKKGGCETSGETLKLLESRSKERITTHNMFVKFSYHI